MAGPIQTAIGRMLGVAGAAAAAGIIENEKNEGQTAKEQAGAKAKAAKAEKSNEEAVKKAIKTAQDKKLDNPKQLYFWGNTDEAVGTSNEIAYVLAQQSLSNAQTARMRSRDAVRKRKQQLMKRKLVSKK